MKNKKMYMLSILSIISFIITIVFFSDAFHKRILYNSRYQEAKKLISEEKYDESIEILESLKDYKDSNKILNDIKNEQRYLKAIKLYKNEQYEESLYYFTQIPDYKNSASYIIKNKYLFAIQLFMNKKYGESKKIFLELGDYNKSKYYLAQINLAQNNESKQIIYKEACSLLKEKKYKEALENFNYILDYKDSRKKAKECQKQIRRRNLNNTISGGVRYSATILQNGKAKAVGDNDKKQCDVENFHNMKSIDANGCLTIGLQNNGKVNVAGTYDEGFKIDTSEKKWAESKFIDVAAGERFVIGLTENGLVVGDGHNDDGQIDFTNWKNEKFTAIDAGWRFAVGLTKSKELKFTGIYGNQLKDFKRHKNEWKDVVNISASGGDTKKHRGMGHTVGLKSDGTVVAVGDNSWGQCEVYSKKWKDIIKISTGDWYTVGLKYNGKILITGSNRPRTRYIDNDVLKDINKKSDIVDITAGYGQTLCLHKDGTISAFGFNDEGKCTKTLKWEHVMTPEN